MLNIIDPCFRVNEKWISGLLSLIRLLTKEKVRRKIGQMNSTLQTPAGNSLSGPLSGKHASRLSGLLLVVMGSVLLIMLFSLWSYKGRFWEDWYPLLISSSYTSEELELFCRK